MPTLREYGYGGSRLVGVEYDSFIAPWNKDAKTLPQHASVDKYEIAFNRVRIFEHNEEEARQQFLLRLQNLQNASNIEGKREKFLGSYPNFTFAKGFLFDCEIYFREEESKIYPPCNVKIAFVKLKLNLNRFLAHTLARGFSIRDTDLAELLRQCPDVETEQNAWSLDKPYTLQPSSHSFTDKNALGFQL